MKKIIDTCANVVSSGDMSLVRHHTHLEAHQPSQLKALERATGVRSSEQIRRAVQAHLDKFSKTLKSGGRLPK